MNLDCFKLVEFCSSCYFTTDAGVDTEDGGGFGGCSVRGARRGRGGTRGGRVCHGRPSVLFAGFNGGEEESIKGNEFLR